MVAQYFARGLSATESYEISYPNFTQIAYPNAPSYTIASSINGAGAVVGGYGTNTAAHSFSFQNGTYASFDPPGAASSGATGITNDGIIYGAYINNSGSLVGYVLQNGTYTTVQYPGSGVTNVIGIGPSGEVVGNYGTAASTAKERYGFILVGGTYYPIGGTPKKNTGLTGVNALGSIIGQGAKGYYIAQCPQNQFPCTQ